MKPKLQPKFREFKYNTFIAGILYIGGLNPLTLFGVMFFSSIMGLFIGALK